ncbi:unnamed protein product, partial [Mesorhabditis spiculigera]
MASPVRLQAGSISATQLRSPNVAADVLESAKGKARREQVHAQGHFSFLSVQDHIISSQCAHPAGEQREDCAICRYDQQLALPHLPEILFPENAFIVRWKDHPSSLIRFTALEALKRVDTKKLPDIQVASAVSWQESRKSMVEFKEFAKPFDWTYTTDFSGTQQDIEENPTDKKIDYDLLKRQDPILFYDHNVLFEDELHDHGMAQYSVRVRVMPTCFFVLARFFLRVDQVHVRVWDTRLFGKEGESTIIKEWSHREANIDKIQHLGDTVINDPNLIVAHLPLIEETISELSPKISA